MGRAVSALAATVMLSVALVACAPGPADQPPPPPPATETVQPELPTPRTTPPEPVAPSTPSPRPTPTEPTPLAPKTEPTPLAPPTDPAPVAPAFRSSVGTITSALAEQMVPTSWREGCPVPLEDLRHLTVSYVTFEGSVALGELVVNADVVDGVVQVFASLYEARFPVRSMRLIDEFGGDDEASMAADNSSAFNCRAVKGGSSWSEHAYGRAIDLNPVENPWVLGDEVAPTAGVAFLDRPDEPGVIHADDVVVRAFAAAGWHWGGYWDRLLDYQHFSVSGR